MFSIKHIVYGGAMALLAHTADAQLNLAKQPSVIELEPFVSAPIKEKTQESTFKAVSNSDVTTTIVVGGKSIEVKGRSGFNITASQEDIERGVVEIGDLNVVFFDVPQEALNYGGYGKEKRGNLSFVAGANQALKYNAKSGVLLGDIEGFLGADYMGDFAPVLKDSKEGDHTVSPKQKATLSLKINLNRPFELKEGEKPLLEKAEAQFSIQADGDQRLTAYPIEFELRPAFEIEYIIWWRIEVAKRLCVQPVRFSRLIWNYPLISWDYTGAGLGFGQPEANSQWAKADVVFTWRDWKTVYNPTLFNFSTSEAYDVMDTVDDDDCVEVFFVEGDNGMHNNWGGGASFWGGESYTKIISSDGNVDAGVDFNHLAHELGHSMDLPHPTAFNSSSTNTLMCPSGFANDNPDRNSQENEDNLSNPLFTFALKLVSAGPDCADSADCGSCP
ncbi:MAG: hypothetical protein K6L81_10120 [Agarilytica sp.]